MRKPPTVRKTPVPREYLPRPRSDQEITAVPPDPLEYQEWVIVEDVKSRRGQ